MDWFKTMTTNAYLRGVKKGAWLFCPGKLWQRNYYDHIIRDEDELARIREYIVNNPLQWELDSENPAARFVKKTCGSVAGLTGVSRTPCCLLAVATCDGFS